MRNQITEQIHRCDYKTSLSLNSVQTILEPVHYELK